jgi:hypothetical protein
MATFLKCDDYFMPVASGDFDITHPDASNVKAAILHMNTGDAYDAYANNEPGRYMGFVDAAGNQVGLSATATNNVAASETSRASSQQWGLIVRNAANSGFTFYATLSIIANGVHVTVENGPDIPFIISVTLLTGADVEAYVSAYEWVSEGSPESVVGLGFQPNLMFVGVSGLGDGSSTNSQARSCLGMAGDNGSGIKQISGPLYDRNSSTPSELYGGVYDKFASVGGNSGIGWTGNLDSFDADGWTGTLTSGAFNGIGDAVFYLAVKWPDNNFDIVDIVTTSGDITVPTSDYTPNYVMQMTFDRVTSKNVYVQTAIAGYTVNVFDGTDALSLQYRSQDGLAVTVIDNRTQTIISGRDYSSGANIFEADGWNFYKGGYELSIPTSVSGVLGFGFIVGSSGTVLKGPTPVDAIYYGGNPVSKIFKGDYLVWPSGYIPGTPVVELPNPQDSRDWNSQSSALDKSLSGDWIRFEKGGPGTSWNFDAVDLNDYRPGPGQDGPYTLQLDVNAVDPGTSLFVQMGSSVGGSNILPPTDISAVRTHIISVVIPTAQLSVTFNYQAGISGEGCELGNVTLFKDF